MIVTLTTHPPPGSNPEPLCAYVEPKKTAHLGGAAVRTPFTAVNGTGRTITNLVVRFQGVPQPGWTLEGGPFPATLAPGASFDGTLVFTPPAK